MGPLFKAMLTLVAVAGSAKAQAADWWWVAGDSKDDVAVFVDGESVDLAGNVASVHAVLIDRAGMVKDRIWRGRCSDSQPTLELGAVARFACGTDEDRMQNAALLAGLSPEEAARAIFRVRMPARTPRFPLAA